MSKRPLLRRLNSHDSRFCKCSVWLAAFSDSNLGIVYFGKRNKTIWAASNEIQSRKNLVIICSPLLFFTSITNFFIKLSCFVHDLSVASYHGLQSSFSGSAMSRCLLLCMLEESFRTPRMTAHEIPKVLCLFWILAAFF